MRADPRVGEMYRQECYEGQAEDMGTVVATDKKITVPQGTFREVRPDKRPRASSL